MGVKLVEPSPQALQPLAPGGQLFHLKVGEKQTYYVAVVRSGKTIRTTCNCWSAFTNFAQSPEIPCCKHAIEAIEFLIQKETPSRK